MKREVLFWVYARGAGVEGAGGVAAGIKQTEKAGYDEKEDKRVSSEEKQYCT
jgi:hypothetical protein